MLLLCRLFCHLVWQLNDETERIYGDVFERVIRIECALRDFELLDPASPAGDAKPGAADRGDPAWRVLAARGCS
ncbi:MAG: hypothetical protein JWN10_1714 [Solirubrobacterales bacterium]|nr:hypothetical protein [Solirubrobacterales bacterium]